MIRHIFPLADFKPHLLVFILLMLNTELLSATENVLKWGGDAEGNAPLLFLAPENMSKRLGFEVDFATALARQMGMKAEFVQNQWDGLIPGLGRREYQVAINGLEITPEHSEETTFSIPYYVTYEQMIVRGDDHRFHEVEDLRNKSIGVLKGSLAEKILLDMGDFDVKTYESEVLALEDLKNRRITATLIDHPLAKYYAAWDKKYRLIGKPIGRVYYGVAMPKSDTLLASQVNNAIRQMIANGTLRKIYEQWGIWNKLIAEEFHDYEVRASSNPVHYDNWVKQQLDKRSIKEKIMVYVRVLPLFVRAAAVTLGLSVVSMIIAVMIAIPVVLLRVYGNRFVSRLATLYIEIIRGTPLLVQLLIIFYALPMIGIKLSPFLAAILGLGINYSAYEAENYRSGIKSVQPGQLETAFSLGMNRLQVIGHIVIPQSIRIIIPPLTNDFIALLKDSSLVSIITMVDLTKVYNQTAQVTYDYFGMGIICAFFYLMLGLPFVKLSKKAEKRLEQFKIKN